MPNAVKIPLRKNISLHFEKPEKHRKLFGWALVSGKIAECNLVCCFSHKQGIEVKNKTSCSNCNFFGRSLVGSHGGEYVVTYPPRKETHALPP